jgi:hypothetical protein
MQSIPVEFLRKKVHTTPVKSPNSADAKEGSACESSQSLEVRITALDRIMLLRWKGGDRSLDLVRM